MVLVKGVLSNKSTVITGNLWNRKTTVRLNFYFKFAWNTAFVQCKQTHFTLFVI